VLRYAPDTICSNKKIDIKNGIHLKLDEGQNPEK
jgi:hypothetical protein